MQKTDFNKLIEALAFAAQRHKDQRRKDVDASPYINHPIALANVLVNEGGVTDVSVLMGALLHDTIEDTETTGEELELAFGSLVRTIVEEVSDDKGLPKAERKQQQVEHAPHISDQAKLVKVADKISNLRDIIESPPPDWTLQRRQNYFDWAKQVVDGLRGVHPELESVFDQVYQKRPFE